MKKDINDTMDETDDMIDLGHECDCATTASAASPNHSQKPKVIYPTVHLELDAPIAFPKSEFQFVGVGRLDRESVEHPEPGEDKSGKYCYDIQLMALKPTGPVEDNAEDTANELVDSADLLERKIIGGNKKGGA